MGSEEEVKIIYEKIYEEDTVNGVNVLREQHYEQEVEILYAYFSGCPPPLTNVVIRERG